MIIRLIVFAVAVFLAISFLSGSKFNIPSATLGVSIDTSAIYDKLPADSKKTIKEIGEFKYENFINDRIKDAQKWLIKSVSDQMLKNLETK